jgi:DNA-binding CsgD family transcriptional regulator
LVYGLVDGARSASEIADVLMVSIETIEGIIRDLQAMQVIRME